MAAEAPRPTSGPAERGVEAPTRRITIVVLLLTVLVAVVATMARQEGTPKLDTLWAEDGSLFLACAYFDPNPVSCFAQPYAGYLHLLPRLGALLASLVPPLGAPAAVGLVSAALMAFAAAVTARAVFETTGSAVAAVLGGATLALVYQAGREVGGEMANTHLTWFAASVVVIATTWLGRIPGAADLLLVAAFGLSSPLTILLVPLALVSVILRAPRSAVMLVVVGATAVLQMLVAFLVPREARTEPVDALDIVAWAIDAIREGFFGGLRTPPDWSIAVGAIVVLGLLALLAAWSDAADRPRARRAVLVVLAVLGAAAVAFVISVYVNRQANPRYAYIPSVLVVEALLIGAALAPRLARGVRGPPRRWLTLVARAALPVAALILIVGFGRSFRLEARASGGPDVPAELRDAVAQCATQERVSVRISPYPASSDWFLTVPCHRLAP